MTGEEPTEIAAMTYTTEGLRDLRLTMAIYEAARSGTTVKV